tara:strand:+ start:17557 stop:18306 length:750 start_codon:yes stop_codon:yes gene_type:complete
MKTILFLNNNPFSSIMFEAFVENSSHEIDFAFIFPFKTKKQNIINQIIFFHKLYGTIGFIKKLIQLFKLKFKKKKYKNIYKLLSKNNIKYERYNSPKNTLLEKKLLKLKPDIIIAALPHIIPKKIIEIPTIGIFNKHSSLTPHYKGVYPIFWQMLNQEEKMGITIHKMSEKIDEGEILYQRSFNLDLNLSFDENYWFIINNTSEVIIHAHNKLKSNDYNLIRPSEKGSYFSYPRKEDIKKFKSLGLRII